MKMLTIISFEICDMEAGFFIEFEIRTYSRQAAKDAVHSILMMPNSRNIQVSL